jgi:hypothetical protein
MHSVSCLIPARNAQYCETWAGKRKKEEEEDNLTIRERELKTKDTNRRVLTGVASLWQLFADSSQNNTSVF